MSSASEFTPWPRSRSLGHTLLKGKRIMKLEWNKLFAEATEKDTKEGKDFNVDETNCEQCDSECSETEYEGNDDNENNENQPEIPLNLCYKSSTVPNLNARFESSDHSLELSMEKKFSGNNCKPFETSQSVHSAMPNLQPNNYQEFVNSKILPLGATPGKDPLFKQADENVGFIKSSCGVPSSYNNRTPMKEVINLEPNITLENKKTSMNNDHQLRIMEKPLQCQSLARRSNDCFPGYSAKSQSSKSMEGKCEKQDRSSGVDQCDSNNEKPNKMEQKTSQNCEGGNKVRFAVPAIPDKGRNAGKCLIVNGKPYQVLAPLGKGGSSYVYLVLNSENELLAVKCVKLSGVTESVKNDYLNEIQHLMRMQHSRHVIRLYDHQYLENHKLLYAVMEKGDTDLSRFLKDKAASEEGITPELILYYWNEMLLAVKSIHDNNIIHRDLKPANFLLVSGRLKLIDFGIASSIQNEQTSILMDTQSGTFNYMSPEALMDLGSGNEVVLKIGRKSDVWSLGCILYYFLYKKTPFQDIVKPLQKMRAITDPKYVIKFPKLPGVPDILIESCKRCLIHDRKKRASIAELLELKNRPLLTLSQVLHRVRMTLSETEYIKVEKALTEEILE